MTEHHPTPGKEQIELLDPFERLALAQIEVISTAQQAMSALQALTRLYRQTVPYFSGFVKMPAHQ